MVRYIPMLAVLGLLLYCVIDVLTTDRRRIRRPGKLIWFLIVLLPVVGAILWLAVGRPRRPGSSDSVIHLRRHDKPRAPDDDPEFLRVIDERAWRARRDALKHPQSPDSTQPAAPEAEGGEDGSERDTP